MTVFSSKRSHLSGGLVHNWGGLLDVLGLLPSVGIRYEPRAMLRVWAFPYPGPRPCRAGMGGMPLCVALTWSFFLKTFPWQRRPSCTSSRTQPAAPAAFHTAREPASWPAHRIPQSASVLWLSGWQGVGKHTCESLQAREDRARPPSPCRALSSSQQGQPLPCT